VARTASTLVVLALLAGTAAAFVVAQRKKLEPNPIAGKDIAKVFSPVCRCGSRRGEIRLRLRRPDRLSLAVLDGDGDTVRSLASREQVARGWFETSWDGRDDDGRLVADGFYRLRIRLAQAGRRIVVPDRIRVDTEPPDVELASARPRAFSPDGDERNERVSVGYELSEAGRPLLLVNGRRRVEGRLRESLTGRLDWYGRVGGRSVPAGRYRLSLAARDVAGNLSASTEAVTVTVRYVRLGRGLVRVRAGNRFGVRVATDARRFRWRFAGGGGTARAGVLGLRAPSRPGRYTLFVEANGHGTRATVIVRPAAPKPRAARSARAPSAATRGTTSGTRGPGR